jgi:ubiquilin
MAPTTIHVKATSGAKITVSVELSLTVAELKATLAAEDKANVPANQQRLIYRGHVMKDERVLESYGLADEHTVHLVKGPAPGGAAPVAAAPAAAAAAAAPAPPRGGKRGPAVDGRCELWRRLRELRGRGRHGRHVRRHGRHGRHGR